MKIGAGFANGHVQAQRGGLPEAQRAILHRHNHGGSFFTTAAKRVVHNGTEPRKPSKL
jgi:hypothetical protein